ncbi:MAG: hypothetical protein MJE77_11260 [Proteobacteria bacterium]|nr:hypothetical protein [Pseudomonadota bacterium]
MKDAIVVVLLVLSLGANGWLWHRQNSAEQPPELALEMSYLQRFVHKLSLAVGARNPDLAGFYLHELEETTEAIQEDIPTYEGHRIAELIGAMFMPQLEAVDAAVKDRDWDRGSELIQSMTAACNSCHQATAHGFIVIAVGTSNPFNQKFRK